MIAPPCFSLFALPSLELGILGIFRDIYYFFFFYYYMREGRVAGSAVVSLFCSALSLLKRRGRRPAASAPSTPRASFAAAAAVAVARRRYWAQPHTARAPADTPPALAAPRLPAGSHARPFLRRRTAAAAGHAAYRRTGCRIRHIFARHASRDDACRTPRADCDMTRAIVDEHAGGI